MSKKRKKKQREEQPGAEAPFTLSPIIKKVLIILFLFALAFAFFLRFYDLDRKPLHHDEGVNAWFLLNLKKDFI